jgi:hypothetical protein
MALQMTSFSEEKALNQFLAKHDWDLEEIRLIVTDTSDLRAEAGERGSKGQATCFYLLHPAVRKKSKAHGPELLYRLDDPLG